jgi:hypothetical protein
MEYAPIYVYVLRVGQRYYFEQGSKSPGDKSVLRAFLSEEECLQYRDNEVSGSALSVDAIELGVLWDDLPQIAGYSAVEYGAGLVLEVDGDVLWDPSATLH